MTVREALVEHYAGHRLPANGGATDPWFHVRIGPVSIPLPNPPARQRALLLHDVNHVVTGYNTAFSEGEMAIAAFEVGAGCGRFAIVWFINLSMLTLGLFFRPRVVFRAFVRGRRSVSIYHDPPAPAILMATTVGEIRRRLRLDDSDAPAAWPDGFSFVAWGAAGLAALMTPAVAMLGALWLGVRAFLR